MRLLLFFILLIAACDNSQRQASDAKPESSALADSTSEGLFIDLRALFSQKALPPDSVMAVQYDHYFKTSKKFVGFSLQTLIQEALARERFDTTGAVVVFECTDGYAPTMDLAKVLGPKKGLIALRDLSAPKGKNWLDSLAEKFDPYYLAWADIPKGDESYVLPYGLTAIRIVSGSANFKEAYPFGAAELEKGFTLFRDNCMKCHAVNKIGGTMGPEFNIPKNITEYWRDEDIIAFAKSPTSYRYNSKMPPANTLSDSEFLEIIRYLKHIAKHKL
ncbi:MAG: c-type cytochrome [Saprospiraceae bacterium]